MRQNGIQHLRKAGSFVNHLKYAKLRILKLLNEDKIVVDFKKLREAKSQTKSINPIEIFERSPKPPGVKDLYGSQSKALEQWFERRDDKDLVIKLPTGGGKTLVGLLIAKSLLNEHNEPVIYLAPTNQLVEQIFAKANEYHFSANSAVIYEKGVDLPNSFLSGKSVLICTYNALFNSFSKFGVKGNPKKQPIKCSAIILDDAHVAFSTVRDSFSITVKKQDNAQEYEYLTGLFRKTFQTLGNVGTFDDIVQGVEKNVVLDVPYWDWLDKSEEVRQYLSSKQENFKFVWGFLRDSFSYCYCLIGSEAVAITPLFPLVDTIPTFADCPRRIFMSATINDDSAIIQTFDANKELVEKPITSESSVGVGERMILVPEWMNCFQSGNKEKIPTIIRELAKSISKEHKLGTVILVPSKAVAEKWNKTAKFADSTEKVKETAKFAEFADSTEKVTEWVKKLQNLSSSGPVIFANRYDGIDLQGDSCRLLILDGKPSGNNEYESYLASVGGFAFNSKLAQRIEQGLGRAARGSEDYCVVIIIDQKLTSWLSLSENSNFLTSTTLAQLKMGEEITRNIDSQDDFVETVMRCLNRDRDWIAYHADTLSSELSNSGRPCQENSLSLSHAAAERKVLKLWRNGHYEKAIKTLEKYWESNEKEIDLPTKGWLQQLAARIAWDYGQKELAQKFQNGAFSDNRTLLRPQVPPAYSPLTIPSQQAREMTDNLLRYNPRRGFLSDFENIVSNLYPKASPNQFEEALAKLGTLLGFATQRPEKLYSQGPDVLWLLNNNIGLVIEAKSGKKDENYINKKDYGQLLTSGEWFKAKYPGYGSILISVLPNPKKTQSIVIQEAKALTFDKINELIAHSRQLFETLCDCISLKNDELIVRCQDLLQQSNLQPEKLIETYLIDFQDE